MENRGKVIEKESDAFSRRAWRIPNSDWQLINTASRHSRGQLARYRNAIFIARARARAPTHTHAHTPSMHETAPATSKLPAISRKSISPVACNFTRRDFSLNASSLFPLHLTRSASSPSSNAQTPPRSLSLSLSPRFSICRRVFSHGRNAGLVTYSPRACKRGELSANRKSSSPPPIYPVETLLRSLSPWIFFWFFLPLPLSLSLWISVHYAARGDERWRGARQRRDG